VSTFQARPKAEPREGRHLARLIGILATLTENQNILCVISLAVLLTILALALWPFRVPVNNVRWLGDRSGLEFRKYSSAFTHDAVDIPSSGSLEIWLMPNRVRDRHTFLGFSTPDNPFQLLLQQARTGLEIRAEQNDPLHSATARLDVEDVFRQDQPVLFTITSGSRETAVYVQGREIKAVPIPQLMKLRGRLVLGDSPGQQDSWRGQVFGLAIYQRELSAPEVLHHYALWTRQEGLQMASDESNVVLYLFDERAGNIVNNKTGPRFSLHIPRQYSVVDQIFLEPFWREFNLSRPYLGDALKNVVGFIPLGFCLYPYCVGFRLKRAAFATVAMGAAVSLIIEVFQALLPTRNSGTTDIITNTTGTWIGVALYGLARRFITRSGRRMTAAVDSGKWLGMLKEMGR
jgi:VanZ family protein